MPGKCRACDITQIYPMEFTIIKSRALTFSRSPQYRAFSRAVIDEKSLSLLFLVGVCGGGAVVTNDWCITVFSGTYSFVARQANLCLRAFRHDKF